MEWEAFLPGGFRHCGKTGRPVKSAGMTLEQALVRDGYSGYYTASHYVMGQDLLFPNPSSSHRSESVAHSICGIESTLLVLKQLMEFVLRIAQEVSSLTLGSLVVLNAREKASILDGKRVR